MAVLTTNNIETVGELDPLYTKGKEGLTREVVEDSDAFLIWDESASKHKKMTWGALNETFDEVVEEAELAEGAAAEAARAAQTARNEAQTAAGTATTKASEAGIDSSKAEAAALVSEGYAVGTQNGTPAERGEPYFQDNAKYYKDQAGISASSASSSATSAGSSATAAASSASAAATSETNAATSETNAGTSETNAASSASDSEASALVSEGWAKGTQNGTAVASGDFFHNNAEWFKDQAAQSAMDAASSASDASDSETAAATSETNAGVSESNALSYKNAAEAAANQARSYAAIILMASGTVNQQKTVSLPAGGLLEGQIIRVMFPVGHNASGSAVYMTLNGNLVLSNQNGNLAPIPIHAMTESGSTVYKVLQANTTLEMYYTADYDGNGTPAFVIVGNPLVLSSSTYSIYANGQIGNEQIATVKSTFLASAPYGWLMCDATVRHKADFPKLWDEIPSVFKNTANNTFVIDLRGRAIMGADASNPLGESQPDTTAENGLYTKNSLSSNYEWIGTASTDNGYGTTHQNGGEPGHNTTTDKPEVRFYGGTTYTLFIKSLMYNLEHSHTINSTDKETRPKNVRMNWIIKY